jgi:hypothetical protein
MKFKEQLPKNSKLTRMQDNQCEWENFRKYALHKGIIITDYNWELKEPIHENSILLTDKEGIHRETTVLIDGILAIIRMRNGEVVSVGLAIVGNKNRENVENVLRTGNIIYFGIPDNF